MLDYRGMLLGKSVQVFTQDNVLEGIFEGIQILGPDEGSPFVVIKIDEDRIMFIPERVVERIYLVEEPIISSKNGEG